MDLIQTQFPPHRLPHSGGISSEYNGLTDARGLQGGNGFSGVGLHLVRNDNMA